MTSDTSVTGPAITSVSAPASVILPPDPPPNQTRSSLASEHFNRRDAKPLGFRRVFTQVSHDLYGTKDVQDVITASYVWMADQIGHLFLGLVPTLLIGWFWSGIIGNESWRRFAVIVSTLLVFGYWVYKEKTDFEDTKKRAGNVFPFDSGDILWNVKTALLYFGIGGVSAAAALIHWYWLIAALALAGWPAYRVAFWWLRRKLAFQQAGLPYLYRLANFSSDVTTIVKDAAAAIANLKDRKILMLGTVFGRDIVRASKPVTRHLLLTGPLGAGKTSLAVGIGTEFAFALGLGRYLSAAKLVQLAAYRGSPANQMEYADGRVLWPWRECELLVIDDVDAGVVTSNGTEARLIRPDDLVAAVMVNGPQTLHWLGKRRSVWVVGDYADAESWKAAIAGLMGIGPDEIMTVELKLKPAA